jgi:hypothetical protein
VTHTHAPDTEPSRRYHLHPGRIGHLFLLADREMVFGDLSEPREELRVHSHGSLHEQGIPLYAIGAGPLAIRPRTNAEVASWFFS